MSTYFLITMLILFFIIIIIEGVIILKKDDKKSHKGQKPISYNTLQKDKMNKEQLSKERKLRAQKAVQEGKIKVIHSNHHKEELRSHHPNNSSDQQ